MLLANSAMGVLVSDIVAPDFILIFVVRDLLDINTFYVIPSFYETRDFFFLSSSNSFAKLISRNFAWKSIAYVGSILGLH